MTEKSVMAFRTISEVSEELGVPQHVLRFWESKFSAIKPMKRGGNRRYYRPEDLQLLRSINRLLYTDGYTIRGVQKLLREHGPVRLDGLGSSHHESDKSSDSVLELNEDFAESKPQPQTMQTQNIQATVAPLKNRFDVEPQLDTANLLRDLRMLRSTLAAVVHTPSV